MSHTKGKRKSSIAKARFERETAELKSKMPNADNDQAGSVGHYAKMRSKKWGLERLTILIRWFPVLGPRDESGSRDICIDCISCYNQWWAFYLVIWQLGP
jgi:hypothetical protein